MAARGGATLTSSSVGDRGLWRSGQYYALGDWGVAATGTPTLNAEYAYPVLVPNACSISKIGAELTTVGATSVLRIGLRLPDANGEPGTLLLDCGTLDGAASTGGKDITLGAAQALPTGLLYVTTTVQVATSIWRTHSGNSNPSHNFSLGTSIPGNGDTAGCYYQTGITGALSTFTIAGHVAATSVVRTSVKIS